MTAQETIAATDAKTFVSATDLLNQWIGHRRLTRQVIAAFPEEQLFTYSIGGMRPFANMVKELLDIAGPGIRGIATGNWENTGGFTEHSFEGAHRTKEYMLERWDEETEAIVEWWSRISEERFQETVLAFGQYEGMVYSSILYFIDNEIHHRAQGYVYLRSLGIEPPAFWNRY